MAINVATTTIPQGSHTFNLGLPFTIQGYTGIYHDNTIPDTWEVRIVTPEGTLLTKTTGISFPDPAIARIFFPIVSGELNKAGVYTYQVAKTTGGANVKSDVAIFTVEESVPSIAF